MRSRVVAGQVAAEASAGEVDALAVLVVFAVERLVLTGTARKRLDCGAEYPSCPLKLRGGLGIPDDSRSQF